MSAARQHYLELTLEQFPRLLAQIDRNPFAKSYGSAHRAYWHHRTADFSSASQQMACHILALLWATPGTLYSQDPSLLNWALATFRFTLRLQHRDGSFDEWYPNERGGAGPTAYVLYALVEAFKILRDQLTPKERSLSLNALRRAARHLAVFDERDPLANHQALACLAVKNVATLEPSEELEAWYETLFTKFMKSCDVEGWSTEYDGADPGYQTATLSFLARLHRLNRDPRIEAVIEPMLEFIACFFYPDGGFAGTIGSRNTANVFVFGFEYWAQYFPMAHTLARECHARLARKQLIHPGDQEDHYLPYRLQEFLEASLLTSMSLSELDLLPYQRPADFEVYLASAGILVSKQHSSYAVLNLRKGGVCKVFDLEHGRLLLNDGGWAVREARGRTTTNAWLDPQIQISRSSQTIHLRGRAAVVKNPIFTPKTFLLFRGLLLLIAWHPRLAWWSKAVIRRALMVGKRRSHLQFERILHCDWPNQHFTITDKLHSRRALKGVFYRGDLAFRVVPQSRYFSPSDLQTPVQAQNLDLSKDFVRSVHWEGNTCVELAE
jgi:hypothetical protein